MDDQNNNAGGSAPSEPAAPVTEPAAEPVMPAAPVTEPVQPTAEGVAQPQTQQQCATCGNTASDGNCVACAQGEANCTCPPAAPSGEVGGQSAPVV
ncbi:hypothetical protein HYU45_04270 [Candidatus Daviesbacteria bacterium]|nr:hypothetical protein [Candidatus Daviesbacteria bacterium]